MELDELERSVKWLSEVVDEFPIGAASLDDFRSVEERIRTTRESLMRLKARSLILLAKYKQYIDDGRGGSENEAGDALPSVVSEALVNAKLVKLCLHSTTILSILSSKEGTEEDKKKVYTYMMKLFTLNDSIMTTQEAIEEASQVRLNLKIECQKALYDYKNFLNEQEQLRSKRLQKTNPGIAESKNKMEQTIRKINVMKKLIRNFIAVSGYLLEKEPMLEMLENNRELINVETIVKMSQSNGEREKDRE
ncbi:PREDICTED: uncharacterized protein LOC105559578 [Vollenhovia emeryi]|uniref:uncharacterized protein LOC105559578 n=1 Tax=Vollenhovia emeryi TaxID=411798 RepID=UPI0005F43799|nr:PREDICTED: uncharacterized protein LOC105559578 [Vollenhovia emeryi]